MKSAQRTGAMVAVLTILVLAALFAVVQTAWGTGQDTCPEGGGWVKVDDLDGLTYTFDVPDGYTVTDNCFKAATTLVFGTGPTVTNTTVVNKNGQLQDISHASFLLVKEDTSSTTTTMGPTTTTTTEPTTTTTTEAETTTTFTDTSSTTVATSTTVIEETTTTSAPTVTTTTTPATTNHELPFTGPPNWLEWLVYGLFLIGAGGLILNLGRE